MKIIIQLHLIAIAIFFILVVFIGVFLWIPSPGNKAECELFTGKLKSLEYDHSKGNDITIQLENNNYAFYINHGLEADPRIIKELNSVIGDSVIFYTPKFNSILGYKINSLHLSRIEKGGKIIYTEF